MHRTLRLVERRTREVRLQQPDVDFLRTHGANVIDVQLGTLGSVRLTPRGFVGFLSGPDIVFEIRPKCPWPTLLTLLGLPGSIPASGERVVSSPGLLSALALGLADRLRTVVRSGLVCGYYEANSVSPFLRGRLRTADQLRDTAARAFPNHFHVTDTAFDLDTPWNRVPKSVVSTLLAHPGLTGAVRAELAAAATSLQGVPVTPVTEADFEIARHEPRIAAYQPLLALCRLIHDGLTAANPAIGGACGFLLDVGRVFEQYLARTISEVLAARPGWSVEAQARFGLGPVRGERVVLQPDLLLRNRGIVRCVLDAKWKRPGPEPDDLHQVLAYAAVSGARHVGLVYPGLTPGRAELRADGGRIRVTLFRLQVVGPVGACHEAVARLVRTACRTRGGRSPRA